MRIGIGFHNFILRDTNVRFPTLMPELLYLRKQHFHFRIGFENRVFDYENWWLGAGIDWRADYSVLRSTYNREDFGFPSPVQLRDERLLQMTGFGMSPIVSFGYSINEYISISTEAAFFIYFAVEKDRVEGFYDNFASYENETKRSGSQLWIQPPLAVFVNLHF